MGLLSSAIDLRALRRGITRLASYGTHEFPPRVRRRLKIMNVTAYVVVVFTLVYSLQHMFLDFETWKPVVIINLVMAGVAATVPFLHRFGELAGPIVLALSELIGIFALTYYVGPDAGLHMQYFSATAAFFVIMGIERLRLIALFVVLSLALHLGAWALFEQADGVLHLARSEINSLYLTAVVTTFSVISIVVYYAFRLVEQAEGETDALLHNVLPDTIVDRLRSAPDSTIADELEEASVLFADLQGFVSLSKRLGPAQTVELLNAIMHAFDKLAGRWGVEKIKTIGDAYMAAAGLPVPAPDHAQRMARMALGMLDAARAIAEERGVHLSLRIGIASGPLLAGVIGAKRLTYDVWGDTVNLASRLEGQSQPGRILLSPLTHQRLAGEFAMEPRGTIELKGFGTVEAWYLLSPADKRHAAEPQAVVSAGK